MVELPVVVQVKHSLTVAKLHPGEPVLPEFPDGHGRAVLHLEAPVIFQRDDPVPTAKLWFLPQVERLLLRELCPGISLVTVRSTARSRFPVVKL